MATTRAELLGIATPVPMGEWQANVNYQKLNIVRYNGASYIAKKQTNGSEPTVSQGWQEVWQAVAYDGLVIPIGTYPDMTVGNANNAQNDGSGSNIAEQFADINDKIPSSASAENQLTDKAFVNSSINAMAAFYITSNSQGDAFPTRAALLGATTFYSGGQARVPTQNDYAIVLADESQTQGADGKYPTTRYSYQGGTYPNGQWDFQYVVNNTSLTQAQVNAINSGITAEKIVEIEEATAAKYTKPTNGIPESDLAEAVQIKLNEKDSSYATCLTSATIRAKTVTLDGFTLIAGARITVRFTYANTTTSPTLNVNSTGAIAIQADGDTMYVKWLAGAVMEFVYDGSSWVCIAGYQLAGKRIGAFYFSNNNTSPANLYGGSWTAITSGYYLKAITTGTPAYGDAGLPNITGKVGNMLYDDSSALQQDGALSLSGGSRERSWAGEDGNELRVVNFNASQSNTIYGSSNTVTPLNRGAYMWYRTT